MYIYFHLSSLFFSCVNDNIRVRWWKQSCFFARILAYWTHVLPYQLRGTPCLSRAKAFSHGSHCSLRLWLKTIWTLAFMLCKNSKSANWVQTLPANTCFPGGRNDPRRLRKGIMPVSGEVICSDASSTRQRLLLYIHQCVIYLAFALMNRSSRECLSKSAMPA